ncbi:MAG: inositol monophosphatase family protein, partial [Candidatus Tectomicrobia bacterium]
MKQADRQLLVEAEAVCVDAARQAGAVLLGYFRSQLQVEFKEKGQQSPVTEADRQSEELLRAALSKAFPEHGIIGEEGEDVVNPEADYVWFLDPLDGTTNFSTKLEARSVAPISGTENQFPVLDGFEQTRIATTGAEIHLRRAGQGP